MGRLTAAAAMTLLSCGRTPSLPLAAASHPSPPTSSSATPTADIPPATASVPEMVTGWHLVHYPSPPYDALPIGNAADGAERWVLGGMRAELRGGAPILAEQELADSLAASCASGNGFVHFTRSGGVYWSQTFLGHLKALGQVDSELRVLQCGPAALTDTAAHQTQLWNESGARVLPLPAGAVVTMSAGSSGHAIVYPDRGFETQDGGKTFKPKPRAALPHPTFDAPEPIAREAQKLNLLREAWLERTLDSTAARTLHGGQLSDGTSYSSLITSTGHGRASRLGTLVKLKTTSGQLVTLRLEHYRALLPWGAKLLDGGSGELRVAYPVGDTLPSPPASAAEFRADPGGSWIFGITANGGLLRFDGHVWTAFQQIRSRPLDVNGEWLLLDDPLRVVPALHPDAAPHVLTVQDGCALGGAALSTNRLLQLRCLESDTDRPNTPRYRKGLELAEIELGSWAESSRQSLPTADASELWHTDALIRPTHWECSQGACRFGTRDAWIQVPTPVVTNLWPPLSPAPRRKQPTIYDPPLQNPSARFESHAYLCQSAQGPLKDVELRGLYKAGIYRPRGGGWTIESINGAGGQIDWPTPTHAAMEWSGRDSQGSFTAALALPRGLVDYQREMIDEADGTTFAHPFLVSRNYALVSAPGYNYPLWILRNGGGVQSLVGERPLVTPPATVPLTKGRTLLRSVTREYQTLRLLDAQGTETARRDLLRGPGGYGDLALLGDQPGLLQWDGQDFRFFSLAPGSAGSVVTLPTQREVDLCQSTTPPGALSLINPGFGERLVGAALGIDGILTTPPSANLRVDGVVGHVGYTWIEVDGGRACLRAIVQAQPYSVETRAGAGILKGWINTQSGSRDLSCAPAPPPAPPQPPPASRTPSKTNRK